MMELIHASYCIYHCDYHLAIVTKYRKPVFNEGIFAYFKTKLAQLSDHLHLLVSIPPTEAVEKVVGMIKQNTAFRKKTDFSTITDGELRDVERELNYRPRKRLGFMTPQEVLI